MTIPLKKHVDFIGYCLQWVAVSWVSLRPCMSRPLMLSPHDEQMISHHHHWEETNYYPMFRSEFDTTLIIKEHQLIHDGIGKVENYLTSCLRIGDTWGYDQVVTASEKRPSLEPAPFDARRLCDIIDAFVSPLVQHVCSPVKAPSPAILQV